MTWLTENTIQSITQQYYKPHPTLVHPEERVSRHEHYLFVRGTEGVFTRNGTRTFVAGDLIYKFEGYWTRLPRQRFSFEKLGFYIHVPEKELPWNQGEKWDSQAPWAGITHETIDEWIQVNALRAAPLGQSLHL